MRLLVVGGASGQVACALSRLSNPGVEILVRGRPHADFADPASLTRTMDEAAPDVVASVGAYTAVDQAEREEALAQKINGDGPSYLAKLCAQRGAPIVHLSTDYVFDGAKKIPYVESDPPHPTSAYGRSKLAGEQGVIAAGGRHAIIRVSWVYAPEGKNFVRTMLRLATTRPKVGVVNDQHGHPTYAPFIAGAVLQVARRMKEDAGSPSGVFHLAGQGVCTWFDFASAIFEEARKRGGPVAEVDPIPSSAYPTPTKRPENSALDSAKIAAHYGVRLPHWREGLEACLDEIAKSGWQVG